VENITIRKKKKSNQTKKPQTNGGKQAAAMRSYIMSNFEKNIEGLILLKKYSHHFLQGIHELLVPHAVEEGVHCWRKHYVQDRHHQVQGWGGDGRGIQVGKYASADKQGDHSQVREARRKGFVPSLLRGDPQHSPEDLHIGQHNQNKTPPKYKSTKHDKANFSEAGM